MHLIRMKMTLTHDRSLKGKRGEYFRSFRQKRVFITHFSTESLWFWDNAVAHDPVLVKYKAIYVLCIHM